MIMDVKKEKILNIKEDEKGQALVEFLLFLPFILMMYSVTLSISNAINASINQQKVTRAYFYYRMQNNATIPKPRRFDSSPPYYNWQTFGMQFIGWSRDMKDQNPVAPCFKFNIPLGAKKGDECEKGYSEKTTQFIRVGTVYGVCGATYKRNGSGEINRAPSNGLNPQETVAQTSCEIK